MPLDPLDVLDKPCTGVGLPLCRCHRCRLELIVRAIGQALDDAIRTPGVELLDVVLVALELDCGPYVRLETWDDLLCIGERSREALRAGIGEVDPGYVGFLIQLDGQVYVGQLAIAARNGPEA